MTATIHHGDCLNVLRAMPDNSVDAVVCDPPYGLSNTTPEKVTDTIVRWAQGDREYVPTGKGFMGASWDAFVPPVAVWDECLRVLKPGGHLVAFAGSRTQDLMGLSIRLAGFDIRENLAWLYGSGFPKSHDISKGIDKLNGRKFEDRYALGRHIRERREALGLTPADINAWFGYKDGCQHWERQDPSGARVPTLADWAVLKPRLGLSDEHLDIVERVEAERSVIGQGKSGIASIAFARDSAGTYDETAPSTVDAQKWSGWGTALKPAHEPIILARKPFKGAVAANTLEWGTGGINVDATRIPHGDDVDLEARQRQQIGYDTGWRLGKHLVGKDIAMYKPGGRWPANVVLDPETAGALDQQSGHLKSGGGIKAPEGSLNGFVAPRTSVRKASRSFEPDSGGASRFFKVVEPDPPFMYAAKAPKRERPSYVAEDGTTIQHSTVKPLSIMSWLCRLVCPEGGTVLDPFAGSGTTVEAAILEGFNVIGIEREADYLPLIQQRIDRATPRAPDPQGALDLGDAA